VCAGVSNSASQGVTQSLSPSSSSTSAVGFYHFTVFSGYTVFLHGLSSCTDEYAHTYYISTYSVTSDCVS